MFPPDDYEDPRIGRRELERLDPELLSERECVGRAADDLYGVER